MTGSTLRNLETFASLCGQKAMPNVVIATTMWGKVEKEEGEQREEELKSEFWAAMQADGCKTARFVNTYESAWRVIDSTAKEDLPTTAPKKTPDSQLQLIETRATSFANENSPMRELEAFTRRLRTMFSR
jgi:hypothetical protein